MRRFCAPRGRPSLYVDSSAAQALQAAAACPSSQPAGDTRAPSTTPPAEAPSFPPPLQLPKASVEVAATKAELEAPPGNFRFPDPR
eukprot:13633450-Heterocapsa_arctica.AAC.1